MRQRSLVIIILLRVFLFDNKQIPFILKALKSGTFHERLSSSEAILSLTLDEDAVSHNPFCMFQFSTVCSVSPSEHRTALQKLETASPKARKEEG